MHPKFEAGPPMGPIMSWRLFMASLICCRATAHEVGLIPKCMPVRRDETDNRAAIGGAIVRWRF
jgi:hypothetical protein